MSLALPQNSAALSLGSTACPLTSLPGGRPLPALDRATLTAASEPSHLLLFPQDPLSLPLRTAGRRGT